MNLILNLIQAVSVAGLAEGMALADRASIPQKDMLQILGMSQLSSPILVEKGQGITKSFKFKSYKTIYFCILINSYDGKQFQNKSSFETYTKGFKYDN